MLLGWSPKEKKSKKEKKMKILYDRIHLRRFSFYYAFRFIRVDIFFKSKEKEGEKKKDFRLKIFYRFPVSRHDVFNDFDFDIFSMGWGKEKEFEN